MEPVKPIRAALPWLLLVLFWTFFAYLMMPKFEEIFRDFGVALPLAARAVHGLGAYWRADFPSWSPGSQMALQVANILLGLGLVALAGGLGGFRGVGRIGWVVLVAVMGFVVWSMYVPLTEMLKALNANGP